jgi:hypothetical protein
VPALPWVFFIHTQDTDFTFLSLEHGAKFVLCRLLVDIVGLDFFPCIKVVIKIHSLHLFVHHSKFKLIEFFKVRTKKFRL